MTSTTLHSLDKDLGQAIDATMEQVCKPTEPGAAVIVARDGKAIYRKGYGMANLELGVKIEPWMLFRIGSITKQFTAVAILILAEQGKLSLVDDITALRLAVKVAAETIGHPYREPARVAMAPEALDTYVDVYQVDEKEERIITRDGSRLFLQDIGGRKDEIIPASPMEFFSQKLLARIIFTRNSDGEVPSLEIHDRYGPIRRATRTSKPLPEHATTAGAGVL